MKYLFTIIILFFFVSLVQAEPWIQFNRVTKIVLRKVTGDGMSLGITGLNNSNIKPGWIEATIGEYKAAKQGRTRIDLTITDGNRVVPFTQVELDALAQASETARQSALATRREALVNDPIIRALIKRIAALEGNTPQLVADEILAELVTTTSSTR